MLQQNPHLDDLSVASWQLAAELLRARGLFGPAEAISNVLTGSDPREEMGLARLRSEQRAHRDRILVDLYLCQYADLPYAKAIAQIEADWREYSARAGFRDRIARKPMPLRYSERWSMFWTINNLGQCVPGARQIRNILDSDPRVRTVKARNFSADALPNSGL